MTHIPWDTLTPAEFEELCADLLKHIGDFQKVERTGGSGDGGADLIAKTSMGSDAVKMSATWWVQCKRSRKTVSDKDIVLETRNAADGDCDVYLIMTTGRLSVAAIRWIEKHNNSPTSSFKISYLDGDALADQLIGSDFPLDPQFSEAIERDAADPAILANYVESAAGVWQSGSRRDVTLRELGGNLKQARKDYPQQFGANFDVAYEQQSHEIRYLDDGQIATRYRLTVINLSEHVLRQDRLTIKPRQPITADDMQLVVSDLSGESPQPLNHRVAIDTDELKIFEIPIPGGLAPLADFKYEAAFRLKYDQLSGDQHFDMPTWALSRLVSFTVSLPATSSPRNAELLRDVQQSKRASKVRVKSNASLHVMSGELEFPHINEIPRIAFEIA